MWLVLAACSGGEGSEDSGEAAESCQSVAVASYEVVPSQLGDDEMPAAMLDPSGSTQCEGDQAVWWVDDTYGWYIVQHTDGTEAPEGATLLDWGVPFETDVILALVPDGEDPETWNPCDPAVLQTCDHPSLARISVEAVFSN